ncbi:MAG TPA: sensor domain-containing diguanylate cyclase [Solirubrobacteraceae bacterium]|nr:sensor domain-containing diguanylate cyclase [Solirubrobacteraceae bacterium]
MSKSQGGPGPRPWVLAAAVAMFGVVLAGRLVISDPAELVGLLFVIPIAVMAIEFGLVGGLAGAVVASVTIVMWSVLGGAALSPLGYGTRLLTFVVLGGLVGYLSEQRASSAIEVERWFEMSNDMLATANLEGYFTRLNRSWEECLGYSAGELMSRPYVDLIHPDDLAATLQAAGALAEGPSEIVNFENRYRCQDGGYRWLLWSSRSDGRQIYAVAKDITARKKLELEREQLLALAEAVARTDTLTGLPNRRAWDEELRREISRARRKQERLAVVMLDVDRLKELNDSQGHQAGDALLHDAAVQWRMALRVSDFAARYGGDEFGVLLPDCPPHYAEAVLARVRAVTPEGQSCSAGIAYWDGEESGEALVARADAALYAAKQTGRNRAVTAHEA